MNGHNSVKYGQRIVWFDFWGNCQSVTVEGFDSPEEAYLDALAKARLGGYELPRWWQWWRWSEPIRSV